MKPINLIGSNIWFIKVETKEFGEILLLEKDKLTPLSFGSEEQALDYIKTIEMGAESESKPIDRRTSRID